MSDTLSLPEPQRQLVTWLVRHGEASHAEIVAQVTEDELSVQSIVDALIAQGFLQMTEVAGERHYRVHLTSKAARRSTSRDVWKVLEE